MDVVRTPEESLQGLPDFPFESSYREIDGLRLAYLDEGEGRPVVFFHGEPTWSFLWRKVIPPVRDAGYRCIAPDYAGFGRSDKPTDLGWYTYDRHVELMAALLEELDVRDATAVVHDWGGPIGLRLAVEHPDRFSRIVIMETGPFTGHQRMSEAWLALPRLRPRQRRRAGRLAGPRRLQERSGRRGDRRLRGALSRRRESKAGAARLPADPADRARRARRRRGQARSPTRCARTSGRRWCSGPTPTRSCPSRSASGSPSSSTSRRRGRSRTPATSCRRTPAPEIGAIIAEWLG